MNGFFNPVKSVGFTGLTFYFRLLSSTAFSTAFLCTTQDRTEARIVKMLCRAKDYAEPLKVLQIGRHPDALGPIAAL